MNILTRVEEEKAINRALSGIPLPTNVDSNRQKSPPPAPVSRFRRENHLFFIKWWHSAQNTKVFGQAGRQLPESPGRHQWSNSSSSSPFLPLSPSVISPSGRPGWVGGGVFVSPILFSPPFPFVPPNFPRLWQLIKAWCWDNNCYQLHPFTPMCHRAFHHNCIRWWIVFWESLPMTGNDVFDVCHPHCEKNFTPDNLKTWSCNTDCLPRWKWFILNFKVPENELSDSDLRMH